MRARVALVCGVRRYRPLLAAFVRALHKVCLLHLGPMSRARLVAAAGGCAALGLAYRQSGLSDRKQIDDNFYGVGGRVSLPSMFCLDDFERRVRFGI